MNHPASSPVTSPPSPRFSGVRLAGRVVVRAAGAVRDHVLRARRTPLPRYITHIVTFRCNARCVMCDSWRKDGREDLDVQGIRQLYRKLPRLDGVRLSGGEPFVHPDFSEIVEAARTILKPVFLHVTTNAFLTDRIVEFCRSRHREIPLYLLVSLDGVGDRHNTIRGRTWAWDRALATLEALAPRAREWNLRLAANQTILGPENAADLHELGAILSRLGVIHNAVLAYDSSATYSQGWSDKGPDPSKPVPAYPVYGNHSADTLAPVLASMRTAFEAQRGWNRRAKLFYLEGLENRILRGIPRPNPPCSALKAHLRLLPDGSVPVCQFNGAVTGNLSTMSLHEVWYSQTMQSQRAWVAACKGCWAECEVLPSALYTGELLRR